MYSRKRRFRLFRDPAFTGGGTPTPPTGSGTDILSFARTLATTYEGYDAVPTDGGALTINSQSVGNYEVTARKANTTISSFTAADWFTSTKDTTSSWIIVNGNLTIDAGQTLIPSVRKLFTVVYVTGDLTVNGTISMTARGANHSGTGDSGGATTAVAIRIGTGTFSAVVNPQIPAAGGAGGLGRNTSGQNAGSAGTNGGTGGGAGGEWFNSGTLSGAGRAGTCFSGGSGGGGMYSTAGQGPAPTSGGLNGGAGGNGGGNQVSGGGAGNPGGTGMDFGSVSTAYAGIDGTGGVLIVICEGNISGTGSLTSRGSSGGGVAAQGGGSGGGAITLLYKTNTSDSTTTNVTGGTYGPGGNGTARKLAIGAN
jgi:hypothetical protein